MKLVTTHLTSGDNVVEITDVDKKQVIASITPRKEATSLSTGEQHQLAYALADKLKEILENQGLTNIEVVKDR